jgi:glycosyltransferase involved in cell wall biosynthesis
MHGLRVAYLAFEPFPNAKGSGTRIHQLASALTSSGAEVHLVTLRGVSSATGLPAGAVQHALPILEDNFLKRALEFRAAVGRELMSIRPDVVHFRGVFEGQAALEHARQRNIPAVFEVNGLFSVELPYHYRALGQATSFLGKLRALEAQTLGAANLVVTQSQTTLDFLRRRGLSARTPTAVIPNGADPDLYRPPAVESNGGMTVLYAGTIAPWQGVAELLMALRRCVRERPMHLCLAGAVRRAWQRQLQRALRRLKVADAVTLHGPLPREALAKLVADADICVAPLRRDTRNGTQGCSPIKLFEYMSAARAVLATDLPCVREIMMPEETGVLATSARPSVLAEQLLRLAGDAELRRQLGERARADVIARATWCHRQAELLKHYRQLVSSR